MNTFWTLTKWQWRTWRNSLAMGGSDRRKAIGQPLGILLLAFIVYRASLGLFSTLTTTAAGGPPGLLPTLQSGMLNGVSLGMLIFLFMTGMRAVNDTLFQGADVPFLLAQPIPVRAIFVSKFIDSYLGTLAYLGPLSLSVWLAFGVANDAPWLFYPLAVAMGLVGMLLFHSIVVLLLLVIMRYVPGPRLKQLFVGLAGVGAIIIVLGSQLMASRAMEEAMQDPLLVFETVGKWSLGAMEWLPHVWLTKAILLPLPAFAYSVWESVLPLVVVAAALAAFATALAGRAYSSGLAATAEASGPSRMRAGRRRRSKTTDTRRSGPYWAVLRKDLALMRRDPLVWYHLAVGTIVVGFFFYNTGAGAGSEGSGISGPMSVMMPSLMASVAATQLGGVGISREGKNWDLLRSQAMDAKVLYWAKLTFAVLPPLIFVAAAAVVLEFATPFAYYPLPVAIGIMAILVITVMAFELLLDILMPDFNLKIAFGGRKQNTGNLKMTIAAISALFYLAALVFVIMIPTMMSDRQWGLLQTPLAWQMAGVGALLLICLITVAVSYAVGTRRLHRMLHAKK